MVLPGILRLLAWFGSLSPFFRSVHPIYGPSGNRFEACNDSVYGPFWSILLCCALLGPRFEVSFTRNREQRLTPVRLPFQKTFFAPHRCCCVQMVRSYQACLTSASVNTTRCLVDVLISAWSKKNDDPFRTLAEYKGISQSA